MIEESLNIWDAFEEREHKERAKRVKSAAEDLNAQIEAAAEARREAAGERLNEQHMRALEDDYRREGLRPYRGKTGILVSLPMMLKIGHTIEGIRRAQRLEDEQPQPRKVRARAKEPTQ